ncbi:MAG: sulfatase [Bacteroidota bacterium]|nr:sulfatase [Bacteroidota bacterium]
MIKINRSIIKSPFCILAILLSMLYLCSCNGGVAEKPNILFIITDDQSWEHAGCYGDQAVRTPAIDKLAMEGVTFNNAYCAAPSCSPSRAGILSGQDIYRLEEGGILTGFIRDKFVLFPKLLEENGYSIGFTGKGYWPRTKNVEGTIEEPIGKNFGKHKYQSVPKGISRNNYPANFNDFLNQLPEEKPFFFWLGINEPHTPYEIDRGVNTEIDTSMIKVPAFLPDLPVTKLNMADYLSEIEWADKMVDSIMILLEEHHLMHNTLIVFTSDNGMPFPRAKSTLYDYGVHMPLICKWDDKIKKGRVLDDPVSFIDFAPTFLELAGVDIPDQMTGNSISKLLFSNKSGAIDEEREFVVSAFEKHTSCRAGQLGFPRRALHTKDWTYIRNFEPDRWPYGDPDVFIEDWGFYGECDPGRLKQYMMEHQDDPEMKPYFDLCFTKVLTEELYNKNDDPAMVHNLVTDPAYESILKELRQKLVDYMKATNDPRAQGNSPWDNYNLDKPDGQIIKSDNAEK